MRITINPQEYDMQQGTDRYMDKAGVDDKDTDRC